MPIVINGDGTITGISAGGLPDNSIQTADIADNQITTGKIGDDQVTLAKMAGGTDGQIITYDASGNPVAVGPGSDGQVLTSTGAGSPPAFEAIPAGGKIIATYAVNNTTGTTVSDSGTWTDTGATITLTPASVTSKFAISVSQAIYIQDSSSTEARGGWRLVRAVTGGSTTELTGNNAQAIYTQSAATGHIQMHGRYAMTYLDDPDTTSEINYHTEIVATQDNINSGDWGGNSMYILEISS